MFLSLIHLTGAASGQVPSSSLPNCPLAPIRSVAITSKRSVMLKERHPAPDHSVTAPFHDPTPPSRPSSLVDLSQKLPLGVAGNNTTRCPDRSTAGLYPKHRLKAQKAKQWPARHIFLREGDYS
jgi:hypothetical protein